MFIWSVCVQQKRFGVNPSITCGAMTFQSWQGLVTFSSPPETLHANDELSRFVYIPTPHRNRRSQKFTDFEKINRAFLELWSPLFNEHHFLKNGWYLLELEALSNCPALEHISGMLNCWCPGCWQIWKITLLLSTYARWNKSAQMTCLFGAYSGADFLPC